MDWRRATIGAAIALPMISLLAFGMTRDPRDIPSPLPGREAPDFTLAEFTAGTGGVTPVDSVHLASMRGDVVVVNVWASWCLACRDEHPALREIGRRYAGTDVHFLGVLYNDNVNNGRRWIEEMGGQSYPALADPGARTAIDYGVYGVPETFFIGRDGRVAYKHTGPITEETLVAKIEALRKLPAGAGSIVPALAPSAPSARPGAR
jgi:cytochrome c biogenesis protein CcmG, thiol:disulfide interchange protein DsbE